MSKRVTARAARGLHPVAIASALLAAFVVGCGKQEPSTASTTAEIRGEPIRGEPIVAQTPEAAPAPPGPGPGAPGSGAEPVPAPTAPSTATAASSPAGSPGAPSSAPATAPATGAAPDHPLAVGFDKLASFSYNLPDGPVDTNTVAQTQASAQIPDTIRQLNDRFISLKGFMLPLKVEKGLVTELLIMRDQSMCCYGTVPKINEWVSVKMVGSGVKPIMDQAVTLFGKLKVGEMYENGYLVGIYALDGERMAGPLDM